MFRHIVLFALDETKFSSEEEMQEQLEKIKVALEDLLHTIPCLSSLKVYFNENPAEAYHFMLEALLPSAEDLPCYAEHPEHLRVARELVKPFLKSRACVDFYQ